MDLVVKKLYSQLILLLCIVFIGCNNSPQQNEESIDFNKFVTDWNNAHNTKDIGILSNLIGTSILFYGDNLTKNDYIENKLLHFKKQPDLYQQIYGNIQVENLNDSSTKCTFVKRVTVAQETKDYPIYLIFEKNGTTIKIIAENDLSSISQKEKSDKAKSTEKVQITETQKENNSVFVTGLNSAIVYSKQQAEDGSEYTYKDGRIFKIKFFFDQVDVMFYSYNENNKKERLNIQFGVGYESDGELSSLKNNTKFLVGQYDFDGDGIDELIIALQENDQSKGIAGVSVNVFRLQNDKWNNLGTFKGGGIVGEPIAEVERNRITIKRNFRDFYYQWTFESGKFKETGDY